MENNKLCYYSDLTPANRQDKRKVLSEMEHLDKYLSVVEANFLKQLFEENPWEYEEMYKHYLKNFNDAVRYANDTVKPKYIRINKLYFHTMYAKNKKAPSIRKTLLSFIKNLLHGDKRKGN